MGCFILDFELTPANTPDLETGYEMLRQHTDLEFISYKAYIGAAKVAEMWDHNRNRLRTFSRSNRKVKVPPAYRHFHNAVRQLIETVNGHLPFQFPIEKNYVHTFWDLCTRLISKLTAQGLWINFNRLLDMPEFLQIKALVSRTNIRPQYE